MRVAGAHAARPVILGKQADGKAGSAIAALGSAVFGNGALRLTEASVARQTFHGVHFLPGQHRQEKQAAIHHAQCGARAVTGDQGNGAGAALALRTAFFRAGQSLGTQEIQKRVVRRKAARIHYALIDQEFHWNFPGNPYPTLCQNSTALRQVLATKAPTVVPAT